MTWFQRIVGAAGLGVGLVVWVVVSLYLTVRGAS